MKRIVRLTESDLTRIVRRVIMEQEGSNIKIKFKDPIQNSGWKDKFKDFTFLPVATYSEDGTPKIWPGMVFFQKGGKNYMLSWDRKIMSCSGTDGRLPCTSMDLPSQNQVMDLRNLAPIAVKYYFNPGTKEHRRA